MSKGTWKRSLLAAGLLAYLAGSFPTADLAAKFVKRRNGGAGAQTAVSYTKEEK